MWKSRRLSVAEFAKLGPIAIFSLVTTQGLYTKKGRRGEAIANGPGRSAQIGATVYNERRIFLHSKNRPSIRQTVTTKNRRRIRPPVGGGPEGPNTNLSTSALASLAHSEAPPPRSLKSRGLMLRGLDLLAAIARRLCPAPGVKPTPRKTYVVGVSATTESITSAAG